MRRKHIRIKIEVQCFLRNLDGTSFEAFLEDISLSGAAVKVNIGTHFQIGDMCDLMLSDESAKFPVRHTGMIVRIDSGIIGVSFLL
jgi:c-di-GMP-binding flagellar brake protein YcgR